MKTTHFFNEHFKLKIGILSALLFLLLLFAIKLFLSILHPKIRTIVTQNLRFENTKPGQEQAIPFDGLCSPASSAYG